MNSRILIILLLSVVSFIAITKAIIPNHNVDLYYEKELTRFNVKNKDYLEYLPIKDTIYVLGDSYIELSLKSQTATLYLRNDSILSFKISSGTDRIKKGLKTPPGLFTVQSKSPMAVSKQFEDAELFNWIGFNGNIGFHGLKGNSYYWRLGSYPSSHGCVRISREDGKKLYDKVKIGTPVFVFEDEPAITLSFAEKNQYNPNLDYIFKQRSYYQNKIIKERLKNLYFGLALRNNVEKLFLDGTTSLKPGGYDIGLAEKIAKRQKRPLISVDYNDFFKDRLGFKFAFLPLILSDSSYIFSIMDKRSEKKD